MNIFTCVTSWHTGRGGAALLIFVLLSGLAATAQTTSRTSVSPVVANRVIQSPIDLYRTWWNMAGQVSQRLTRANDRLPKGPIAGLTGKASFIADHMAVLDQSVKMLEGKVKIPDAKLKAHQARVLAFLNRATEIDRLLNDLERSEADDKSGNDAILRKNIQALAGERLFAALQPSTPARLRALWSDSDLAGVYTPNAINRLKVAIENSGDETATDVMVTLSPSNSLIASVADGLRACVARGNNWTCRTGALTGGQQWPIAVTLRHPDPYQVGIGAPVSVGVSIVTGFAGGPPAKPVTIAFQVANCQANLSRELTRIGTREGATLLAALKAVQSGADSLNGTWISRFEGAPSKILSQMLNTAAGIVEARGADPWFTTTKDGRAAARAIVGLVDYLQQTQSAAQCSIATQMIAGAREQLKSLYLRMEQVAASRQIALRAATSAVRNLEKPAGDPAPGDASANNDARALLARLDAALNADIVAQPEAGRAAAGLKLRSNSGRSLSRLEALSARLPDRSGDLGETQLGQAKIALASIEAAVYFELAQGRYEALRQSLEATFAALLVAENAVCRCKAGNIVVSSEKSSAPSSALAAAVKPEATSDPHPQKQALVSRRVINPPGPRRKPVDHQLQRIETVQPINNVRAAARRAAKKRRLRRLD